jgi:hypothetical protein
MNAVHRTYVDTRGVLRTDTWLADDIRHVGSLAAAQV